MIDSNEEYLFPVMLKNLRSKIHHSNNKRGAFSKAPIQSHVALKNSKFIEFNSKKRVTLVVFDKDTHQGITALEYFKDIPTFFEWLIDMINITPTYVCQTDNGFQFAFAIKSILVSNDYAKNTPSKFLADIKAKYIQYLELDSIASSKDKGIFRNPMQHKYLAFPSKVFTLNDLNKPVEHIKLEFNTLKSNYKGVSKKKKIEVGERNDSIYRLCCREFAYKKTSLTQIFSFAKNLNNTLCVEPIDISEIKSISNSVYKSYKTKTLTSPSAKANKNRQKKLIERKKEIIKYFLKCKEQNRKPVKAEIARSLNITIQSLNSTYGEFIRLKYKI